MNQTSFILKGDICFCKDTKQILTYENHYLICERGLCKGVVDQIPEQYQHLEVYDHTGNLIVPGLIDLHIHAPQYAFRGLGMDMGLLEWLEKRTFPEEQRYESLEYAKKAYTIFAQDMLHSATTRMSIFGTIHVPATLMLMDCMEETGLKAYVGKVNMDRNAPDYQTEMSAEKSMEDTVLWLDQCHERYENIKPILTPRFIITCSDELMKLLKVVQDKYALPLQSHLSEAVNEVEFVRELCPYAKFYGDAYDSFGLFGKDVRTIMAHCVYSSESEIQRMKERGIFIAHCPESNTNLASGIAPIRKYLDYGLTLGLGSDVAGGTSESIFVAMAEAIKVSKLRWRLCDPNDKPLSVEEAFYLGTKGGGSFFGRVGSFEEGYEFDAVVMDDSILDHPQSLSLKERLERVIYLSQQCKVAHKYVGGKKIY